MPLIDMNEYIAKTAFRRTEDNEAVAIDMPVTTWYDIGERFKGSNLKTGYKLKSDVWFGLHNGKKVIFKLINRTLGELEEGSGLIEIMRVERVTDYSFIPNGKKREMLTTYQRIPIPGVSENVKDLVPEQMTKNIIKKFFYEQISDTDLFRHVLSQIVTQTDMLCVTQGKDVNGNTRDPVPVHLQLNGISFRVAEGVETEFIEAWKVETESFGGDEIIMAKHESHYGVADVESSTGNASPPVVNIAEPCTPPYIIAKAIVGEPVGKTEKIENPNLVGGIDQVREIAETILKVRSWTKQIDRQKTYLGIIPIQVIGKSAGNVGYTISVNHMQPSATTTITHREMIEDEDA